jgi:hypothetical protein
LGFRKTMAGGRGDVPDRFGRIATPNRSIGEPQPRLRSR